ncbi:MAG: hypothetical protein VW338_01335 [Rhodospirillaceae bacterium]
MILDIAIVATLVLAMLGLWSRRIHGNVTWRAMTLGFGLIVTVQGFETSRYLGDEYDATTRNRSMR